MQVEIATFADLEDQQPVWSFLGAVCRLGSHASFAIKIQIRKSTVKLQNLNLKISSFVVFKKGFLGYDPTRPLNISLQKKI